MVVEGATENVVIRGLLAAHLGARGIFIAPKIIGKATGKGGHVTFDRTVGDVFDLYRQEPTAVITTFIDFYGRSGDWPGENAHGPNTSPEIADRLQLELENGVRVRAGGNGPKINFIPYIQVHGLEAILFAQPAILAGVFGQPTKEPEIAAVSAGLDSCEDINDNPQTAPSKRIEAIFGEYKKGRGQRSHARVYAERAELAEIRSRCPRFHAWVERLEAVGGST